MFGEFRPYPPTARRREELRRAGDVPASPALTAAVVLTAALVAASLVGARLAAGVGSMLRWALTEGVVGQGRAGLGDWPAVWGCGRLFSALALAVLAATVAASAVQTELWWRSPLAGRLPLRLTSRRRPTASSGAALGGLVVVAACLCAAGVYLVRAWHQFAPSPTAGAVELVREAQPLVAGFLTALCVLVVAVGVGDLLYRRWLHERRAWMTRSEFVEAMREQEGHPLTLLRRERRRRRRR